MVKSILEVKDLSVSVNQQGEKKSILEKVSFKVEELSILSLVGGSGSGKTTIGLSILQLLGVGLSITEGNILLEGKDLLEKSNEEMRKHRGKDIGMVFQEPLFAFNPVFSVGFQIQEVIKEHLDLNDELSAKHVLELLDVVGLEDPVRVAASYPHQLSGGMRQRAMIAQAIAGNPKLIIADEPTSNLDVTLQAKIMDLFRKLQKELKLSIILISHDLGMVSHLSDYIVVMNQGMVAEQGVTKDIIEAPKEEYTKQLMKIFEV